MEVIVETPKGSRQKFKFDEAAQKFEANKTLPGEMRFPFNFGFLPGTKGEDGDPLDAIVLSEKTYQTGEQVSCRLIGCFPAKQTNGDKRIRNDRFVTVAEDSADYLGINEIAELPEDQLNNIKSFFVNYLAVEQKEPVFLPDLDSEKAKLFIKSKKLLTNRAISKN